MNCKKTKRFGILASCAISLLAFSQNASAQAEALVGYCWSINAQNARGGASNIQAAFRRGEAKGLRIHTNSQTLARPVLRALNSFPNFNDNVGDLRKHLDDIRNRLVGSTNTGISQLTWENNLKLDMIQIATIGGGANGWGDVPGFYSSIRTSREDKNTSAHEIGHNYSATHEAGNRMVKTPDNQLPGDRYTSLLSGGQSDGNVVEHFSNPNVSFLGARTGTSAKNNVSRINNRRFAQAQRR